MQKLGARGEGRSASWHKLNKGSGILGLIPFFISNPGLSEYLLNQAYVDILTTMRIRNSDFLCALFHKLMSFPRKWPIVS